MRTGGLIRGLLWVQIGLAAMLFGGDLLGALPELAGGGTRAPALTRPVAPGDQTRRFAPADLPPRETAPGAAPVPAGMPARLLFATDTGEGGAATLRLTGEIAPGDAQRLREWLSAAGTPPARVLLHSPGGSVRDALDIGRQLRALGVATQVGPADMCLSACPYILAAGAPRGAAQGALVGVHQHYFGKNAALPAFLAVEDIQRGQGDVMGYLDEMGVDPRVMRHALLTPPDEIYLLTAQELTRYRLVTTPE